MGGAYLRSRTYSGYVEYIERHHPWVLGLLHEDDVYVQACIYELSSAAPNEFEDDTVGRGESYRRSQTTALARREGIRQLVELAIDSHHRPISLLDLLGGNGTVAKVVRSSRESAGARVLTSDISPSMVESALRSGLPAIREDASRLLLASCSVDAVLLAYGTHHIDESTRMRVMTEAWRVLRPGGRLVVHDFDDDGPVARWFREVVDKHSLVGHPYVHFKTPDLETLLSDAGFCNVNVREMLDPIRVTSMSQGEAWAALVGHVGDMYGILPAVCAAHLQKHFHYSDHEAVAGDGRPAMPNVRAEGGVYVAEVPRVALVASAEKALP